MRKCRGLERLLAHWGVSPKSTEALFLLIGFGAAWLKHTYLSACDALCKSQMGPNGSDWFMLLRWCKMCSAGGCERWGMGGGGGTREYPKEKKGHFFKDVPFKGTFFLKQFLIWIDDAVWWTDFQSHTVLFTVYWWLCFFVFFQVVNI